MRVELAKEGLTFTGGVSPMAHLMLSIMGAFAEFERALLRERQREGIVLAKQRGAYRGRKKALLDEQVTAVRQRAQAGEAKLGPRVRYQPRDVVPVPASGGARLPRRALLTTSERAALLAFPADEAELIRHYACSERDLSLIRQHRGGHNRLWLRPADGGATPTHCLLWFMAPPAHTLTLACGRSMPNTKQPASAPARTPDLPGG